MRKLWSSELPPSITSLRKFYSPPIRRPIQLRPLSLAYDLHRPPGRKEPQHAPIVIMHGLFGSKQNNRSITRDLGVDIYAVDLRNHGDSPHDATHTYDAMTDDVEQFMRAHGLQRPTLIGHSMGAKVAMTLALRSPATVGALIPVDNAPVDAALRGGFAKYVYGMKKILEGGVTSPKEADAILQECEESLPIRQFLLTNLVRPPRPPSTTSSSDGKPHMTFRIPVPILAASLGNMGDFPFKDPDVARYEGPTLFVRGVKSEYVPDDVLPLVGRFFPRFEVRDVDSGHWVLSEQPEAFRRAVVEFLGERRGEAG